METEQNNEVADYTEATETAYHVPQIGEKNQSEQVQEYQQKRIAPATSIMDIKDLQQRRDAIRKVYENVMQDGIHYGKPFADSDKPTLLKAGGEVLCATFMLSPKFSKTIRHLGDGHREIDFSCNLFHIPTGRFVGEGVGSCSTMESKYRYRYDNEPTGVGFGKNVWDAKDAGDYQRMKQLLRKELADAGQAAPPDADVWITKDSGQWQVAVKQKIENPDIANEYNTVLKIAKKRALNDAILTATGASEYFTQDLEDIKANEGDSYKSGSSESGKKKPSNSSSKPSAKPKAGQTTNASPPPEQGKPMPPPEQQPMTDAQEQQIKKLAMELPDDRRKKLFKALEEKTPSIKWGRQTYTFLSAYNKLKKHFNNFEQDESKLPDEYWDTLEACENIEQLTKLNDRLGAVIDAVADGVDDPFEVVPTPKIESDD